MTHTYARLPLSREAYEEVSLKLKEAGYHHAFENNGDIDMHGIGICIEAEDRHAALLGSDLLPSMVVIKSAEDEIVAVQLGVVVRKAFERSGMTLRQWNAVPCSMREVMLAETVEFMKTEI
jgi:hypothetical protein